MSPRFSKMRTRVDWGWARLFRSYGLRISRRLGRIAGKALLFRCTIMRKAASRLSLDARGNKEPLAGEAEPHRTALRQSRLGLTFVNIALSQPPHLFAHQFKFESLAYQMVKQLLSFFARFRFSPQPDAFGDRPINQILLWR